jgi:hypothetical protein
MICGAVACAVGINRGGFNRRRRLAAIDIFLLKTSTRAVKLRNQFSPKP